MGNKDKGHVDRPSESSQPPRGKLKAWDWDVKSQDSKGRSARIQFRAPPQWYAWVQRLTFDGIAKNTRPWKSPTDCMRTIFLAGLRGMAGEIEAAEEILKEYDIEQRNTYNRESMERATQDFESTKLQVQQMIKYGHTWHAAQLVRENLKSARERPQTYWSDWLIDELTREFQDLVKRQPERKARVRLGRS